MQGRVVIVGMHVENTLIAIHLQDYNKMHYTFYFLDAHIEESTDAESCGGAGTAGEVEDDGDAYEGGVGSFAPFGFIYYNDLFISTQDID